MADMRLTDDSPDHFPGALVRWVNRLHSLDVERHNFDRAFAAIDKALQETVIYMMRPSSEVDRDKEVHLAQLWYEASQAISPIDPSFANAMAYKGLGWANPYYWHEADGLGYKIHISDIQKARTIITNKRYELENKISNGHKLFAPEHITASKSVLLFTLLLAGAFGIGCIYGGIQLMSAPGSGETVFDFIGLKFSTKQAGVAAIALGAATIILTFRRVLTTVVNLGRI